MEYTWHDLVGNIGVAVILLTYLLLQLGRIHSGDLLYSLLNAAGAALIVLSLTSAFNLSAFVVEAVWVIISLLGVAKWFRRRAAGTAMVSAQASQGTGQPAL